MAEAARVLDYLDSDYYGTAAPALAPYGQPYTEPVAPPAEEPTTREQTRPRERAREIAEQNAPAVSLFAVFGAVFVSILMIFVVLAQINYTELAGEIVRLNAQLSELIEEERKLEIEFENAIDMKEVEMYARDTLGMSKPDADQIAIIRSLPSDSAEILSNGGAENTLSGFGAFLQSLLEYLR